MRSTNTVWSQAQKSLSSWMIPGTLPPGFLWDTSAAKWINFRQDVWQTRNIFSRLWWLMALAPGIWNPGAAADQITGSWGNDITNSITHKHTHAHAHACTYTYTDTHAPEANKQLVTNTKTPEINFCIYEQLITSIISLGMLCLMKGTYRYFDGGKKRFLRGKNESHSSIYSTLVFRL